jgi:hypothetical protein
MNELHISQERIEEYVIENLEFSAVRKYYVQECLKKNMYDVAIQTLEKGKEIDKSLPGIVLDYSLRLKDLYKQTGRVKDYENELWLLMLQYRKGDVAIYKELKTLYTDDEWSIKREKIFEKTPLYNGVDRLYKEDKLYDRLLKIVLETDGLNKLIEYEDCLKKLYPEELIKKYEIVVNSSAQNVSSRKHYCELVAVLRRMRKYPGGIKIVEGLVRDWRFQYKNRPAMMDELNKI